MWLSWFSEYFKIIFEDKVLKNIFSFGVYKDLFFKEKGFVMVKKRGLPGFGELVLCRIKKINPNSAEAYLEEYNKEGMIHVSEVSPGWVRDIRQFLRIGQTGVAKVIRVDQAHIALSLKRVEQKQENDKIKEYKLNQRAEKMLEIAAKKLGKTLDHAYEEVGFILQEKFGTMYDGFKIAIENPQILTRRGVPDRWVEVIREVAEKSIEQKEFVFSANMQIKTFKPNGINIIKAILDGLQKSGLDVRYIAAPTYLVKFKTKNAKAGQREFLNKLDTIVKGSDGAEISYTLIVS